MANFGQVLTVAQALSAALESSVIEEICSMQSCQAELEGFKEAISSIIEVLPDAEAQLELPPEAQGYVELLKEVVYESDDFFDEILTMAKQQQKKNKKLSQKVRDFFSQEYLMFMEGISLGVEGIKSSLDALGGNKLIDFGLKYDCQSIKGRRHDNGSDGSVGDVFGMEDDMKSVMNRLLDSDVKDDLSFVTLLGVGGVGKTTLARHVYYDEIVKKEFPLRLWFDLYGENFSVKSMLGKIGDISADSDDFWVESRVTDNIGGKKYLIVFDDMGSVDHCKWTDLGKFLMQGDRGSRIVVTTRSEQTSRVIGDEYTHELRGLSPGSSWLLFGMTAFDKGQEEIAPPELVEIGKKIVAKCPNVPHVIKVVGSLLYGQDINIWRSFEEKLAEIREGDNKNMSILKLSYHNLTFQMKSCFGYCALFPQGFIIDKEMLISLWMAQGYIVPPNGGQSIEDLGKEYFLILSRRCFLEVVGHDEFGDALTCKINSLMDDLAVEVAEQDTWVLGSFPEKLGNEVRHLFYDGWQYTETSFTRSRIRSYLHNMWVCSLPTHDLVANWTCLRALDLHGLDMGKLPDSIGNMLHLRYLDLSKNNFQRLPYSLTKLHNLQTLKLCDCLALEELPNDLNKLVNLRLLNLDNCPLLAYLPLGLDKLTSLRVLIGFVVAKDNSSGGESLRNSESSNEDNSESEDEDSSNKLCVGHLNELKALSNLSYIKILSPSFPIVNEIDEEGYLKNMEHLKAVLIHFEGDSFEEFGGDYYEHRDAKHESLLEKLQPHPNVRELSLCRYEGVTIPRWGRAENNWASFLPNLVKIELICHRLQHLPLLSKLQHLRSLTLFRCVAMESIENTSYSACNYSAASELRPGVAESTFFPSLQHLEMSCMPQLKGWWTAEEMVDDQLVDNHRSYQPSFPCLLELSISSCPELISFPHCPRLETLHLGEFNEKLKIFMGKDDTRFISTSSSYKLRKVQLDNVGYLKSLPTGSLSELSLRWDHRVESLSELAEVFKTCSVLRSFAIEKCDNLRALAGLEHLTSLESLSVNGTDQVFVPRMHDDCMPWKSLHSLRSLKLCDLQFLLGLPRGMQYLTALRNLDVTGCLNFRVLPEWISCLSFLESICIVNCSRFERLPESLQNLISLQRLQIEYCKVGIKERCQKPDGEDWHKIQHIRCFIIKEPAWEPEISPEELSNPGHLG